MVSGGCEADGVDTTPQEQKNGNDATSPRLCSAGKKKK